ncbi:DUF4394 domain-containing protein [Umezawaea endophytica]|uniref:DUF4394 domain-containing protein n=1 Tax=Umezawaea endophytica TaxID=1654476 RepID=A0A9X3A365_9PSEU|nr:DUF4394 domain-containing protein [Umezawaea endophytica]MCS7481394.1 DUF4394 domain-containing protein [Umezawaea endophytica]
MRKARFAALAGAAALLAALTAPGTASATGGSADFYVLTEDGVLAKGSRALPLLGDRVRISGLAKGDRLVGIDVRPATGALYAVGKSGQLYTVAPRTGAATKVGAPIALDGSAVGFDFNPTVDRIRLVTSSGQNLRLVPETGALAATDGVLAYAATDRSAGQAPKVAAAGYTNSVAGSTSTALYGIDANRDALVTQGTTPGVTPVVSPNTGQLFTVGKLGLDVTATNGFDISGAARSATFNPGDYQAVAAVQEEHLRVGSLIVRIDLATGRGQVVGLTSSTVVGLAFAR